MACIAVDCLSEHNLLSRSDMWSEKRKIQDLSSSIY